MEKKEEVKEDEEKPAWIRQLEELVAGLWLWQEEEANAGSTVESEGRSKISQVRQLGTHSKKNYGIIWEFFPSGGPPPLLGTPYSKKKIIVYFAF